MTARPGELLEDLRVAARFFPRLPGFLRRQVTGAEARAAHDAELWRLLRLWMANRGVWEAMEWAGPAISVVATEADVDGYLATLGALVTDLVA